MPLRPTNGARRGRSTLRWLRAVVTAPDPARRRVSFTGPAGATPVGFDGVTGNVMHTATGTRAALSGATISAVTLNGDDVGFRVLLSLPTAPMPYNARLVRAVQSGGAMAHEVRANTSGELDLINTAGAQVAIARTTASGNPTYKPAAGAVLTIEGRVTPGTSPAGSYDIRVYAGDWDGQAPPVASMAGVGAFAAHTARLIGNVANNASTGSVDFYNDAAIGPALPLGRRP